MSCLANIFWVQNDLREIAGILDLSHRDVSTTQPLSPPMISIPTPHSSRPWCGGLINQRCYIQLHRKCSKREPSHSPPVLHCNGKENYEKRGRFQLHSSTAGVQHVFSLIFEGSGSEAQISETKAFQKTKCADFFCWQPADLISPLDYLDFSPPCLAPRPGSLESLLRSNKGLRDSS